MSDKGFKVEVTNLSNLKELLDTASRQTSDLIRTLEKINNFNFEVKCSNKKAELETVAEVDGFPIKSGTERIHEYFNNLEKRGR